MLCVGIVGRGEWEREEFWDWGPGGKRSGWGE